MLALVISEPSVSYTSRHSDGAPVNDDPAQLDDVTGAEESSAPKARAKPLSRRLPLATDAPDLVPARMINEALYCECRRSPRSAGG